MRHISNKMIVNEGTKRGQCEARTIVKIMRQVFILHFDQTRSVVVTKRLAQVSSLNGKESLSRSVLLSLRFSQTECDRLKCKGKYQVCVLAEYRYNNNCSRAERVVS